MKTNWQIPRFLRIVIFLCCLFVSACGTAEVPPILSVTPGAGVVIVGNSYRNDVFSVQFPAGWRVITSPAGAAPSVTFVAPGDCALILVASTRVEAPVSSSCDSSSTQTTQRAATLGSQSIFIAARAPSDEWDDFLITVDRITESVKAPT